MSNVHCYPAPAPAPAPATGDEIRFAYWVPNVSGGLVVSKIEQRTDWGIDYNRKLAQSVADLNGLGLSEAVLEKVSRSTASRLLKF